MNRELCVGAEVYDPQLKHRYIVTKINGNSLTLLRKDGTAFHAQNGGFYTTGRWFDIESILERIGE